MSRKNSLAVRLCSRLAPSVAVLGVILLVPAIVWARGRMVRVPPPNGTDDTANIQAALNACVGSSPGCTVQLQAGTYHTTQVIVHNFQGTFKGMGKDKTTIEALYLYDNWPDFTVEQCQPNLTTCVWTTLITFVNGNIAVSDLTISVPLVPATQTWVGDGIVMEGVYAPLEFNGWSANVTVDRIAVEGQPAPGTYWGYNILNGIHYSGELPRSSTPYDNYCLSGSYTVRSSYFNNTAVGISQDMCVTSSKITIGGSPGAGNYTQNDGGGIDLEGSQNSVFDVSYNNTSGVYAGMWVVPSYYTATSPSKYTIHDNNFVGTEQYADGMYLYDNSTNPFIQAAVWNNNAEVQATLSEGLGVYYTKGTAVLNNTVTGTDGYDGIGLWGSSQDVVIGNNVSGFTVDPTVGYAQIYLDPYTTQDLVVCAQPSNTVLNTGTNNLVIGCTAVEAAATSVDPATSKPLPRLPKGKH